MLEVQRETVTRGLETTDLHYETKLFSQEVFMHIRFKICILKAVNKNGVQG